MDEDIAFMIAQLQRSERGRRVCVQLLAFLDGDFLGCDDSNRVAVESLIQISRSGYAMSVRDHLREVSGTAAPQPRDYGYTDLEQGD